MSIPTGFLHSRATGARRRFPWALALVAVCLATPAMAQRASLADRIALLEQQAAASQGNVELLNQITQLRTELRDLRAQIEELQRAQEQQAQAARSQYLDLDSRINRLEGGPPATGVDARGSATFRAPAAPPTPPAQADRSTIRDLDDPAPTVHGDAGLMARGQDEREDYLVAFELLKSGDYAASAPDRLRITEIFLSLQGETRTVGLPTVFVRLTGCPLRCATATPPTPSTGGELVGDRRNPGRGARHGVRHVCVTGGEPLAQRALPGPADAAVRRRLRGLAGDQRRHRHRRRSIPACLAVLDLKTPGSGSASATAGRTCPALRARPGQVRHLRPRRLRLGEAAVDTA
jgi:cell division protein FtsB